MAFLGILSALVGLILTVPYCIDMVRGRVHPARSTRILMFLLISVALAQQASLGSSWALGLTIGEGISALVLLVLSIKYGVGGTTVEDKVCYALVALSLVLWAATSNPLYALLLTITADMVAFWPTLSKTWRWPGSETPLFYWGGVIAGVLAVFAEPELTMELVLFPAYIAAANFVEVLLIYRGRYGWNSTEE